ncbi:hypothetical protein RDWZM_010374 [Blomia tropicalis]|uniref:F-box domain-containing protein n=1 Tax=Blomia tropicalis TaxID=40697 RepID=A0A9Q0RIM2_BLOTA|nr:hypothetical protein RDWZM_010374 [Blomia tropicalis]
MNTKLILQRSNQLPYIPYTCLVKITSHLTINDLFNLMETCFELKDRIEEEILPRFNSICFCFSYKCSTHPKDGLGIFHVLPPITESSMDFIWKYDSIQKLLSKHYYEITIIIKMTSMNQIFFIQDFFQTFTIDGKVVTIQITSRYEVGDFTFPTLPNSTEEFRPFFGIQTFESVEQLRIDIDLASTDIEQIISTSMNKIIHLPLRSFCLNIDSISPIVKIEFERLCKLKSDCKFQLGFRSFFSEDDILDLYPITNSSNITEIDLIQYDYINDWKKRKPSKMDIRTLEAIIRYAPNVSTLKTNVRYVSPNNWTRLFSQMSSLTNLEILWWYDDKVWRFLLQNKKIRCTTLYNIQHLTLVMSNETHGRLVKLLRYIKFPSLQTFTIKSINPFFSECNYCFNRMLPGTECVRYIYDELAKNATNLKSFFAFGQEWLGTFQCEN